MKVAFICSNLYNIDGKNKTGTGIFSNILLNILAEHKSKNWDITVFASGASSLPFKVDSIDFQPSSYDSKIIENGKHIMFELALISKAFMDQGKYDLFHVNIGDGDLVMPFAGFVKKPILITLHNIKNEDFTRKYFSFFKKYKNVHFISVSNYQRKILPMLNYVDTIYHGIDTNQFGFDANGGKDIMWAGRLLSGKGPDVVIELAKKLKRKAKLFGVIKDGHEDWFDKNVKNKIKTEDDSSLISLRTNYERSRLVRHFQNSKLFILPTLFEEAFGFVFAEAMACGTPVVTFARGSAPEIIKDGETGFLINPSNDDIRGDWIIKKTGFAGLCEAVEKIYSLPLEEYRQMRKNCRDHAVKNFSAKKMAKSYLEIYEKIKNI
jgi:glycosyltransferase involved in cell wall biosynthesis